MRPARRILLYAFGPVERGALAHLLRVRGYRVAEAHTPEDVQAIAADPSEQISGVLIRQWHPHDGSVDAAVALGKSGLEVRLMFVGNLHREMHTPHFFPSIWLRAETSNAEILESLRILVQRKRGPKRKTTPSQEKIA